MGKISDRLSELGISLSDAPPPAANYSPYVKVGNLVIISGQLPMKDGKPQYIGKVGRDISLEEGQECAKLCGVNVISQLNAACNGDLDAVERCVRLGVFVNSTDDYREHPAIANGVSDLIVEIFGKEKGTHARAAVGVSSLPLGVAVEVEAIFELSQ